MIQYYKLIRMRCIKCSEKEYLEWNKKYRKASEVKYTNIENGKDVFTYFLGSDASKSCGIQSLNPLLFTTRIQTFWCPIYFEYSSTYDEALITHQKAIDFINKRDQTGYIELCEGCKGTILQCRC